MFVELIASVDSEVDLTEEQVEKLEAELNVLCFRLEKFKYGHVFAKVKVS